MANKDYKNGKLVEIIREFNHTGATRYEINGINQAIAIPFWRIAEGKFKVIPKGSYRIVNEAGNNYIEITDSTILKQATQFQICYIYTQNSSKYIEEFPELSVMVDKYNELVDDATKLFSYLKSVGMVSDTLQLTKVLTQLEPLTTWYMDEQGEIKALPISELYNKFQQMIDTLYKIIKEQLDKDYENYTQELRTLTDKLLKELKDLRDKCTDAIQKKGDEQLARLEKAVDQIADQQFFLRLQPNTTIINLPDTWVLSNYRTKVFIDGILIPSDSYTISERKITLKHSYPYGTDVFINDMLPIGYVKDAEKHFSQLVADWKKDINLTGDINISKVNNAGDSKTAEIIKKILTQESETLKKFSSAESSTLAAIKNKGNEELKKLENLGIDIETQLSILLEQADLANLKTLIGENYKGIFDCNIKYYPGDIYYKKDSTVVEISIPNVSNPEMTRACKVENIKKFFRLHGGQELEFNFTGNGDNKVVGVAIEDSNNLVRTNSCVDFELNIIDYTVAIDIPNTTVPELIKIMTSNQDDSSTVIIKKQEDLPVWEQRTKVNPALRKFNY